MAKVESREVLPPVLGSSSEPPASLFDGTTRLYTAYVCPYAQRVWIARNYKGLQDKIQLVPIDLQDKPIWYTEKVYPPAKVPALEHNNEIKGESLDLLKYIDTHFEGPPLFPHDPAKNEFVEEMLAYTDKFGSTVITCLRGGSESEMAQMSAAFDKLEEALSKFDDGPFFLGQFSAVDIAYAPFIERYQLVLQEVKNYDIKAGRPKLAAWLQEMENVDAYKQTKWDPQELVSGFKRRLGIN